MTSASQVGELFLAAGSSFSKLGDMTMKLYNSDYKLTNKDYRKTKRNAAPSAATAGSQSNVSSSTLNAAVLNSTPVVAKSTGYAAARSISQPTPATSINSHSKLSTTLTPFPGETNTLSAVMTSIEDSSIAEEVPYATASGDNICTSSSSSVASVTSSDTDLNAPSCKIETYANEAEPLPAKCAKMSVLETDQKSVTNGEDVCVKHILEETSPADNDEVQKLPLATKTNG